MKKNLLPPTSQEIPKYKLLLSLYSLLIIMIKKILLSLLAFIFLGTTYSPVTYASDAGGNPNFYTALFDVVSTDWNIL